MVSLSILKLGLTSEEQESNVHKTIQYYKEQFAIKQVNGGKLCSSNGKEKLIQNLSLTSNGRSKINRKKAGAVVRIPPCRGLLLR